MTCLNLAYITGYDRSMFTRIRNGYIPPKKTVISLGIALGLNINEMEEFLYYAGYVFSEKVPIDVLYRKTINQVNEKNLVLRFDECNDVLRAEKVGERYLLGN